MIWRTCGSLSRSSARSEYSTRAIGLVGPMTPARGRPGCRRRPGVRAGRGPASLRFQATAFGPADQSRDRRVVDAGLLGELPLGHLLGFELGSQPFVERSAVLARHRGMRAPLERCGRCRDAPTIPEAPIRSVSPVRHAPWHFQRRGPLGMGAVRCRQASAACGFVAVRPSPARLAGDRVRRSIRTG